ncbi:unnamed protein product [Pleuronectes platessa]|uniref:Uncharacterized protein n=1 Tax=Pleuronectes platessa TaxID=8262 RepID=A0A9N7TKR9_PLEPL|nr:unnamed protein product [Pleuronectes platessa]
MTPNNNKEPPLTCPAPSSLVTSRVQNWFKGCSHHPVCLISNPAAIPLTLQPQGMLVRPEGPWVTAQPSEVISIHTRPSHQQLTAAAPLCVSTLSPKPTSFQSSHWGATPLTLIICRFRLEHAHERIWNRSGSRSMLELLNQLLLGEKPEDLFRELSPFVSVSH